MNTILVPTDFSAHSENAAFYAWQFAKSINASIKLCNAFTVPAEEVVAAQVAWPLEDYKSMQDASFAGLESLSKKLHKQAGDQDNVPKVSYANECGSVADVVGALAAKEHALLTIVGTSKSGGLVRFLWGSNRNS
jgi:nucleotide-binding universal stress UspA family protein